MNVYEAIVPSCAEGMQAAPRFTCRPCRFCRSHSAGRLVNRDVKMDGKTRWKG
jgi:hypothetical protein